jgi:hypothetical protein
LNILCARQTTRPLCKERPETGHCEQYSERTSGESQDTAFRETLTYQSSSARAQSHAQGEFTFARHPARQQ